LLFIVFLCIYIGICSIDHTFIFHWIHVVHIYTWFIYQTFWLLCHLLRRSIGLLVLFLQLVLMYTLHFRPIYLFQIFLISTLYFVVVFFYFLGILQGMLSLAFLLVFLLLSWLPYPGISLALSHLNNVSVTFFFSFLWSIYRIYFFLMIPYMIILAKLVLLQCVSSWWTLLVLFCEIFLRILSFGI